MKFTKEQINTIENYFDEDGMILTLSPTDILYSDGDVIVFEHMVNNRMYFKNINLQKFLQKNNKFVLQVKLFFNFYIEEAK